MFSLNIKNKTKAFTLTASIPHGVDSSSDSFFGKKYKEKEIIHSVKEEISLSLLANNIIINVENPAEFTQKAASSNSELNKFA